MALTRNTALQALGLPSTATEEDIKVAYRKLASKYHPDKNTGDAAAAAKMRDINEARDFLDSSHASSSRRPNSGSRPPWAKEDFEGFDWAKKAWKTNVSFVSFLPVSLSEVFHGSHKVANFSALGPMNFSIPIPKGVQNKSRLKIISTTDENDIITEVDVRVEIDTGDWTVKWALEPNLYGGAIEGSGDMEKTIHVDMLTMMRGGSYTFDTIDGTTLQLRIVPGMESGTRLKVKGRGYWKDALCSARGDVFLRVMPKIKKIEEMEVSELEEYIKEFKNALLRKRDDPFHDARVNSTFA